MTVRLLIQQVKSAKLKLPTEDVIEISKGMVVFVCFLQGVTEEAVLKAAKTVRKVKLSEQDDNNDADKGGKRVNINEVGGDILVIPQATLGGKLKGNSVQYHNNIKPSEGDTYYKLFCDTLSQKCDSDEVGSGGGVIVRAGVWGARQIKISTNMTEAKIKELQLDVSELKSLQEKASRSKVKDILSVQVRKLETDLVQLRDKAKAEEAEKKGDVEKKSSGGETTRKILECQLKDYSWDQSEKFVKLYLTGLNGLDKCPNDNINITYSSESVNVRVGPLSENQNKVYVFSIKKTCHQINPEKSYHKAKSDYLLVFLAKHNAGSDWSHITHAEKAAADAKKKSDDASKLGDKDDPSAGLMNMMKKMYDEGDDEMKRTIAKAWTEGQEKKNPMTPF